MTQSELLEKVDHTLLKATAVWSEIEALCEEAIRCRTASVCIPPSFVGRANERFGEALNICTVIGFPLGYNTTAVKVAEVAQALADGAREVDMVVNLGWIKEGRFDLVTQEIAALKAAAGGNILKVIVETCYLTEAEKIALCGAVTDAKADYIKTSTGFGTGGAVLADIELFRQHIGRDVKIKASGGIRTREEMEQFVAAGCDRLGTSAAVKILESAVK